MLQNCNGKLLIYASCLSSCGTRLKSVSKAAERIAKLLKLDVETVLFRKRFTPIYVYFENSDEEPIPIYCDHGEKIGAKEVCTALRNMMFVLSFHPKHSALKPIREQIIRLS